MSSSSDSSDSSDDDDERANLLATATIGTPPDAQACDACDPKAVRRLAWDQFRAQPSIFVVILLSSSMMGLVHLARLAVQYRLKDGFHVPPAKQGVFDALVYLPWALKPVFGFLSDCVPIRGRRRKPYVVLASFLASAMWLLGSWAKTPFFFTLAMVLQSAGIVFANVIAEALVVELSRGHPVEFSSLLLTMLWSVEHFVSMFATLSGGFILGFVRPVVVMRWTAANSIFRRPLFTDSGAVRGAQTHKEYLS